MERPNVFYGYKGKKCLYEPPAGPTIREAIQNAINIAKYENAYVEVHMNDITLLVHQNSSVETVALKYFIKLEKKYKNQSPVKTAQQQHVEKTH